jgi:predicted ATPase
MAKYILTGAPGTGKSTLLEALRCVGWDCRAEVSRQLIIEETATGSTCLPWINLDCFARKALDRMIDDFEKAGDAVFFDRGIPDIIAYLQARGLSVDSRYHVAAAEHRYHPVVLFLPLWEEIYVQDPQRWQTFAEAKEIERQIRVAYELAGYRVIEVPRVSVQDRVVFIQEALKERSI